MFRYLVLGLLRSAQPLHGYALMKEYRERSGTAMSTGCFYRELARLVAEGLVTMVDRTADSDPRRTPYVISERGAEIFDAWLSGPHRADMGSHDDEISVALLFLDRAERPVVQKLFRSLQEDLWMRSKTLERAREAAARTGSSERRFDSLDLLLGRRQKHVAAEIEFLEEVRASFDVRAESTAPKGSPRASSRAPAGRRSASD